MLQVSKGFVDSFLHPGIQCSNCSFTEARTVLVFCSTKLSLRMRYFNPSDLPQDYISLGYSSIVVPIYDMRY